MTFLVRHGALKGGSCTESLHLHATRPRSNPSESACGYPCSFRLDSNHEVSSLLFRKRRWRVNNNDCRSIHRMFQADCRAKGVQMTVEMGNSVQTLGQRRLLKGREAFFICR